MGTPTIATYSGYTDQELLAMLREGDWSAFDALYDKHWHKVYANAFKKMHDPDLAKDITQEVFIYLWTHREGNYIDNLEAYLFSAVRNNVFRALKKDKKFLPIDELLLEVRIYCSEADARLLEKEFFEAYNILVEAMPAAQRSIYKMKYHENMSTIEIAERLNISRKTVQNQLTRAVHLLRASLLSIAVLLIQQSK